MEVFKLSKLKTVVGLFLFTCILSMYNVKADSFISFIDIKIPSAQVVYTSDPVTKTTISEQYVKKNGAIDSLSGDERAIGARLKNITTYYVETEKNKYVQLFSTNSSLGANPGVYELQLKANKWTVTSVSFTGSWALDAYTIGL